jgi:hypothetical protein
MYLTLLVLLEKLFPWDLNCINQDFFNFLIIIFLLFVRERERKVGRYNASCKFRYWQQLPSIFAAAETHRSLLFALLKSRGFCHAARSLCL